jgi:hypothetical protein
MTAGATRRGRLEYFCGSYFKVVKAKRSAESPCLRNGVFQDQLEDFLARYLDETGQRLEVFLQQGSSADAPTGKLEEQEAGAWKGFVAGVNRLCSYLMQYHPAEYAAILNEQDRAHAEMVETDKHPYPALPLPPGSVAEYFGQKVPQHVQDAVARDEIADSAANSNDFVAAVLHSYRSNFDAASLQEEITRLEAEYEELMEQWKTLPTQRARDKATERFQELEARLDALKEQQQDSTAVVERHYREMRDLQKAIADAKRALASQGGERSRRQRAEALRSVIQRIDCTFTATRVKAGRQGGQRASKLVSVMIHPLLGDAVKYPAHPAHSPALPPLHGSTPNQRSVTTFLCV